MNHTSAIGRLEREIAAVQQQLLALGPLHPGSVSRQYHVCGRRGCRCLHPTHPQRHGPYHKLAYVHRGRAVCRFVRAESVREVKQRLAAYKRFRQLVDRWIELSIQRGIREFFGQQAIRTTTTKAPARRQLRRDPKRE